MTTLSARSLGRHAIGAAAALAFAAGAAAQSAPPSAASSHGMLEDPFNRSLTFDELETRHADGEPSTWDMAFWAGGAFDRLTVRSQGERADGDTDSADLELLYTHAVARWWDVVAGARADFEPGESRGWAAFGVQGLAPYRFELEATAYVGDGGDVAARFDGEYELLITNRLILQPRIELDWYGQEDPSRGIGSGLSSAEIALRLRYELRREVAPYVGLVRERRFGGTADFARAAGVDADDTRLAVGVRLRF